MGRARPADGLVTTAGERLQVIYPGHRTGTGGPDFQSAIVADACGRVRAGDVELHLRSRDWLTHGHRANPAYDAVILHVVLQDDGLQCLRADGAPVPVVALSAMLKQYHGEIYMPFGLILRVPPWLHFSRAARQRCRRQRPTTPTMPRRAIAHAR